MNIEMLTMTIIILLMIADIFRCYHDAVVITDQDQLYKVEEEKLAKEKELQNILNTEEIQELFSDTLKTTKKEIIIISPWINKYTIEKYEKDFYNLLKKNIKINIIFGNNMAEEKNKDSIHALKLLLCYFHSQKLEKEKYSNLKILKYDTHEKIFIKDEDFYCISSFNILSRFNTEGTQESGEICKNKNMIKNHIKRIKESYPSNEKYSNIPQFNEFADSLINKDILLH